ncbi:MAG: dihydrolipoamide dehydrogenase, partial [Hypericibacter sp.]
MAERISVDLCVVGAGAGGLAVAGAGAQLGLSTVLVKDRDMGDGELDGGDVASKALIAAARAAVQHRQSEAFGVRYDPPRIDFARVRAHVKAAVEAVAPDDSQTRYEGLGVRIIRAR